MINVAQVLLFDARGRLLIYLRDNNPDIPFPNHWDFFGGHVERGETPEQALVREVIEELGIELRQWRFFRLYHCTAGDVYPNVKHIYWARIDHAAASLTLREGQRLMAIRRGRKDQIRFANILGRILDDFVESGLWPEAAEDD